MSWCDAGSCLSGTGLAASTFSNALQFFASMQCLLQPPAPTYHRLQNGSAVDFVIVGGGTAGCALAARLAESNFSVLVLEAGPEPPVESNVRGFVKSQRRTKYDWNLTVASDYSSDQFLAHKQKLIAARMLGGLALFSGNIYSRGSPHDFDAWADELGDPTWKFKNLLPYFKKTEKLIDSNILNYAPSKKYHGHDGEIEVSGVELTQPHKKLLECFNELGFKTTHDYNNPEVRGAGPMSLMLKNGRNINSLNAMLNKVANKPNVFVMTEAEVTQILIKNNTAFGVKAIINEDEYVFYAKKEVILSAGAFHTPKLLMLSGIGPKSHLEELGIKVIKDLPVGENLQDHLILTTYIAAENGTCWQNEADEHFEAIKYLYNGSGSLGVPSIFSVDYSLEKSNNPLVPDISFFPDCVAVNKGYYDFCRYIVQYPSEICARLDELNKFYELIPVDMIVRLPKFKGRVTLASDSYRHKPIIKTGALSNPEDLDGYPETLKIVSSLVNTTYLRSKNAFVVDLQLPYCDDPKSEEGIECIVKHLARTTSHAVGTAAMGKVLDTKMKVIGMKGLRVVDASTIPLETRAGTIAPVLMIVEKASEFIKNDYHNKHNI